VGKEAGEEMNERDLVNLKLALECISINANGFLERTSGETCDDIEKLIAIKYQSGGCVAHWRQDSFDGYHQTNPYPGISFREWFERREHASLIDSHEVRQETWYYFPENHLDGENNFTIFGRWSGEVLPLGELFDGFSIMRDGVNASKVWSVRQNDSSAEVAVETLEPYRRQGFAKRLVKAWVYSVLRQGKIPIYAHRVNYQSQKLAQSLGAVKFAEVVSYQ
jgi:RimJ/RimL family protein N-acetyltransferase